MGALDRYKMLTPAEELALARRYREDDDAKAAEALVLAHKPLVYRIATDHRHYLKAENLDRQGAIGVEDLAQEGMMGMVAAVRTFDPNIGVRLHYHARPRITGAIRNFIMEKWSLVKIGTTEAQRKLFWSFGRTAGLIKQRDPDIKDDILLRAIANRLDVPLQEVADMAARLSKGGDMSLNETLRSEDSETEWIDLIGHNNNPEQILLRKEEMNLAESAISDALDILTDRERRILTARWLVHDEDKVGLKALAAEFGVSIPRIHQIANDAFAKVKDAVTNRIWWEHDVYTSGHHGEEPVTNYFPAVDVSRPAPAP
jgi:RNA polymerase sigma-32 factor